MAKGTLEVGGTAEGGKMASLEVEQSATGGVAGALKVDNDDVDKQAIVVEASNTTADVADIAADAVTTAKVIDITADALTSGSALYIDSDSASTTARSLVTVIQNHASAVAATGVTVQSDGGRGVFIDSNLAAGLPSLEIDSEHTTANTVIINGDALTTGTAIQLNADALTTGSVIDIDSNSSTTGTRDLVSIVQNHASATGATTLYVQNDSTGNAINSLGDVTIEGHLYVKKYSAFQTTTHSSLVLGNI
jgi:hypothetical protein